jgi:DNA polymerase-3 subunit gamma/tau
VKYQDVLRNLNVLDYEYSFSLVDAFLKGDYPTALLTFDEILTKGFNALHFVAALSSHLRDLIVSKSGGLEALLELPDSLKSKYKEQSDRCSLPFLYEALNITTACESGYRASVNPRLHIEFALMRLSFVLTKMPAPAQQQVPTQAPAAAPVSTPAAATKPSPAPTAPAPSPEQPAPAPSPAPAQAQPQRRERVARTNTAAASVKSLIGNEPEIRTEVDTGSAPSEETLRAKWPELAKEYASKPRMASMLSTTTLKITGDDTQRIVTFMVDNDAQKDWVESKLLHDLEGRYQKIVGSGRVVLRVDVIPHEEVKPVAYMPEDKIKELMAQNEEVKSFVKDLGLDIK